MCSREGDQVVVENSVRAKALIETMLDAYGCTSYVYGRQGNDAWLIFEAEERRVMFRLKLPDRADEKFTRTPSRKDIRSPDAAMAAYEKEIRYLWGALADGISARLAAVRSGISTFQDAFLANIVLPGPAGQTVGEYMAYQLEEEFRNGEMRALAPGSHPVTAG
jgi:hypothetical protein